MRSVGSTFRLEFRGFCSLSQSLRQRADEVASFVASGEAHGPMYEALLAEFMLQIIDQCSQWRLWRGSRTVTTCSVSNFRIRRAIAFLHEHLGCPPSVHDLARVAGLSRAHFFALFHQHTRVTPHVYANTLRMEAAYHALPDASMFLAQLSQTLGFAAQSHFSRFFRNHLSFSPAQYRRVVRLA